MIQGRVKVTIYCRQCGERFILRGRKDRDRIETGFMQCVCENSQDLDVETDE